MSRLFVVLSVDWEPDKGAWKYPGSEMDYGGIIIGTPAFCRLLDELQIPCTWFIETSYDPKRDLPGCFLDVVRQLAQRKQDEVGLHIHWRRPAADNSVSYETSDISWTNAQLDHGVRQLDALGARPKAFRSGALLHVKELPRMLSEKGFLVDSSTLWGRANRLKPDKKGFEKKPFLSRMSTLLERGFGSIPEPYLTHDSDVEQRGGSGTLEIPITYSLFDTRTFAHGCFSRFLRYKALMARSARYLMLFFHIDELTNGATGPDQHTDPDPAMLRHFREHLISLQKDGAQFLTCSEARTRWLRDGLAAAQEQHVN